MLGHYHRTRLLLIASAAVSCLLFWSAGRWFGVPRHPGYEVSLLLQPSPFVGLMVTAAVLLACVAVSTVIAGSVRLDAGLFGAAIGLMALSLRGGPMRYVLLDAPRPGTYLVLIAELVLLFAVLALAGRGLWVLHRGGRLVGDAQRDGVKDEKITRNDQLVALATQAAVMAVLLLLLTPTDEKKQVLAAVVVSSFVGTAMAYSTSPVRPSVWYWAGPLLVGVFGYAFAFMNWLGARPGNAWQTGQAQGMFAGLARPLPLDYASAGVAAAILGYWMSRRWQRAKELERAAALDELVPAQAGRS